MPRPTVEAPPPYSESHDDALVARSASLSSSLSSVNTLSSTRSEHVVPVPVSDTKIPPSRRDIRPEPEPEPEQSTEAGRSFDVKLPSGIQRAQVPLSIKQSHQKIVGDFLLLNPAKRDPSVPDVLLETKHSRISSGIYLDDDEWGPNPISIELTTTHSNIESRIYTSRPGQAVDIRATTKHSNNYILLPRDFTGLLVLSTSHSQTRISPALQAVSVVVPNRPSRILSNSILSGVTKAMMDAVDDGTTITYEINGSDGPSCAIIKSAHSKVGAGFVGEESQASSSSESKCAVM